MDTRLLRTFVTVAEQGSFSAAADMLGYTQSAVSQQIAALEADLGAALLNRRPVGLTEPGTRLLEHARPLLLRMDAARADVARAASPPPAVLVLGAAPLVAPLAVAGLSRLRQARPRLEATLRTEARDHIATQVAAGSLDLGLVDGIVTPGDPIRLPDSGLVATTMMAEAGLAVMLPDDHPLSRRRNLRLADLADARWIDAPDTAMPLGDLRIATGSDGFQAGITYQGADLRTLLALVAAGHGLAILPVPATAGVPGITSVPLSWPPLVHRIAVVHGVLSGVTAALASALAAGPPLGEGDQPFG